MKATTFSLLCRVWVVCGCFLLILPAALAEEKTLALQLNDQNVRVTQEQGRTQMQIDLISELRKQHGASVPAGDLDLKKVVLDAKSRIGGGQIMLRVQRGNQVARYVDLTRVETDPELFETAEAFQKVQLVNFEASVTTAELVILNPLRLRNLQIVLGASEEIRVAGTYGGFNASKALGLTAPTKSSVAAVVARPQAVPIATPPSEVVAPATVRAQPPVAARVQPAAATVLTQQPVVSAISQPAPQPVAAAAQTVAQAQPPPRPQVMVPAPQPAPVRCLQGRCIGQSVYHRHTYLEGTIVRIDVRRKQVVVRFGIVGDSFESSVAPNNLVLQ